MRNIEFDFEARDEGNLKSSCTISEKPANIDHVTVEIS